MADNNQKWLDLFKYAREIQEVKPWKYFWDVDFFELRPFGKERVYVSFLGSNKQMYGVCFYIGSDVNLIMQTNDLNDIPPVQRLRYQKCIACYFSDKDELSNEELNLFNAYNSPVKGKHKYIQFIAFNPIYHPYTIEDKEINFLSELFPVLIKGLNRFITRKLEVNFAFFEVPVYQQTKQGNWSLSVKNLKTPYELTNFMGPQILDIDTLMMKPKNDSIIEMDIAYTGQVYEESEGKALHARLCLIGDGELGQMLSYRIVQPNDRNSNVYIEEFQNYIIKYGRPNLIVVRDIESFESLFYLARTLDINIQTSEVLELIDNFILSMSEFEDKPFTHLS